MMTPNTLNSMVSLLLLISSVLLLFHASTTHADSLPLTPNNSSCDGGSYTGDSAFSSNLDTLFTSLTSKSSSTKSFNATAGSVRVDRVYGLYACQGDLTSSDCHDCIKTATSDIVFKENCSRKRGIIWYDYCILRYSDQNFFGVPDASGFNMTNPIDKTSSAQPLEAVSSLVQKALSNPPLMFASSADVTGSMYAVVQCTGDLNADGCRKCLETIIGNIKACCTRSNGWRFLAHSCWIRYEATVFLRNLNGISSEVRHQCSDNNLTSDANLTSFLSTLPSKANPTGFYNATTPDGLYGLALCRGDLATPSDACSDCLNQATSSMLQDCTNKAQGIEWYEKCLVRYSNQSFFGVADGGPEGQIPLCGVNQVTDAVAQTTNALALKLVALAPENNLMFAAGKVTISDSQSSYVLVQCTRDLSVEECKSCLDRGLRKVITNCNTKNGWRYMSGSCTIRYESSAFFDTLVIAFAPPPPPATVDGGGATAQQKKSSKTTIAAIVGPILGMILLGPFLYYLWWRLGKSQDRKKAQMDGFKELPLMELATIQKATNNFSSTNKLGEGGFGPVYKGTLLDGKEIAIKRLSAISKQGSAEFKNEVELIAKLQHRNLVRILGCCIEREEKLLVYEYLPNRSLDAFLFDPDKRAQLNWRIRLRIIAGIVRGLLYLHEDSLLKVIHRDLKASNILLDNDMNPKISDFGMAKIFGGDESEANTRRIAGTYGYMAPEYAMDGIFSAKSDVFSFGVLMLEILSGQKNGRSHFEQHGQTLLRYAWQLWNEKRVMELMDPLLGDSCATREATKCIHIGLLCIQEKANERPTILTVGQMLRSEQMVLPQPDQPPTFVRQRTLSSLSKTHSTDAQSINEVTNTDVAPR